jgi:exosortase
MEDSVFASSLLAGSRERSGDQLERKMRRTIPWFLIAPLIGLIVCLLWVSWPDLVVMADRWSTDPRYAHGYLVPMFAIALLWLRREQVQASQVRPSNWGIAFIVLGGLIQLTGGYFRHSSVGALAILPYLAGIALILGGWLTLRWSWPSILFLCFMIPLPFRIENALGPPLQWVATRASASLLRTMGFMAFSEGNVIQLNDARIGVVEACSGLSMLITFVALSTGMALVVNRPLLDKIVLVLSAIPVALSANIARIAFTGILHETVGGKVADHFYHDLAGWVMIPFALILYWCVIWVFSHILVETEPATVLVGVPRANLPGASQASAIAGTARPAERPPRGTGRR